MLDYTFTEEEFSQANQEWGANCGPAALSFIVQKPLDYVRNKIPNFEKCGFTSTNMMQRALANCGFKVRSHEPTVSQAFDKRYPCLVRIQFEGPWTTLGANPKWASCYTHWVVCYVAKGIQLVFDINGGIDRFNAWEDEVVAAIAQSMNRATGKYHMTHVWSLEKA